MCSFITQHNATDVASFEGACNWYADCRNVHQRYCCELNAHFCTTVSVHGIVWVSGLLMSMLWIEWPMVAVGLWYGQAYVMDNEHRCILLMAFWMHRDTVMRSWGPLLCHSSMTITSCCSMIMHGPLLQGFVHNYWKLKTSEFLHGQHTHRTCHPLSMFGMLWIGVYDSLFQFLPISSNFAHSLKRSGPTFHRPKSTTWSTLCKADVLHFVRQMVKNKQKISILICHTYEVDGLSRQRRSAH